MDLAAIESEPKRSTRESVGAEAFVIDEKKDVISFSFDGKFDVLPSRIGELLVSYILPASCGAC